MHRLVAKEFIENPENRSHVDFIDTNKQNNCVKNVRWASRSENQMKRDRQHKPCSSSSSGYPTIETQKQSTLTSKTPLLGRDATLQEL